MAQFKEQQLTSEKTNILNKNQKGFKNGNALSRTQLYLEVAKQFAELEGKDYNKLEKDEKDEIMDVGA